MLDLAIVLIFVHCSLEGRFRMRTRQLLGTTAGVFDSLWLLSADLFRYSKQLLETQYGGFI